MPESSEIAWFIGLDGESLGPMKAEDAQHLLEVRNAWTALVWRKGLPSWEPAVVHFSRRDIAVPATPEAAVSACDGNDALQSAQSTSAWRVAACISLLVFVTCYAALFSGVFENLGSAVALVYGCVWISGLLGAVLLTIAIWKLAERNAQTAEGKRRWGLPKALSLIALLASAGLSVLFCRLNVEVYRISKARESFADYTLRYDPLQRAVVHSGPIGDGFAAKLKEVLHANSRAEYLIINSPGGLLDEAMDAANIIEAHPEVAVVVRGQCSSACVIVMMAAKKRIADFDSAVGLHAASSITDIPKFMLEILQEDAAKADEYLISRGMPKRLVDEGNKRGPDGLLLVTAIELVDEGVIFSLLDNGEPIRSERARWLWIAQKVRDDDDKIGFADLASAFAESNNKTISDASRPIFSSIVQEDLERGRSSMRTLVTELLPNVLASADPVDSRRYISASASSIDYLATSHAWKDCAAVANGVPFDVLKVMPPSAIRNEFGALSAAVKSANFANWAARPIPAWARSRAEQVFERAASDVEAVGVDVDALEKDDRGNCLFTQAVFRRVLENDPTVAVSIYRYIASLS